MAITLSSCREISISTLVNKDGSFTRIVTITGDSTSVFKALNLPYPVDETWHKEYAKDTVNDEDYILTYTKFYKSSDLINQEMNQDTGWRKDVDCTIDVEKTFFFFYSYLTYTEIIKSSNPFTILDYKDYLSKEDLLWLGGNKIALNGKDSVKIEQAVEKSEFYLKATLTEEIVSIFKTGLTQLNNPDISPEIVDNYKDSIANKFEEWGFKSSLEFVDDFAIWTGNDEVCKLKDISHAAFMELDSKIHFLEKLIDNEDYKVSVEMPGILTATSSPSTKGNIVSWNINTYSFLFEDITMEVESRIINKWMFVLAGLILLSLIALTIFKSRK